MNFPLRRANAILKTRPFRAFRTSFGAVVAAGVE
jgi:hypothetical protein